MTTVGADTYGIVPEDEFNEFVAGPGFWVLLIMGILWVLLSFLLLQFTYASITALSVLVGIVLLVAAASEIAWAFVAEGWKWLHGALGVLFVLGAVFAFVFHGYPLWWVGLIAGVIEIAFAFWAVGYVGRSAALLLIWVGIGALMRGITSIVAAFQLRHAAREVRV
jgi:uncharacterized membrane protein HdeD (DUF308 family)